MRFILWFDQLNKESLPLAGGKGANLGEMVSLELPVPHGFVVNTKAFEHYIKTNNLDTDIDNLINSCNVEDTSQLNETSARIKRRIMDADYPLSIKQEITGAYNELSYSRDIKLPAALGLISAGREMAIVAVRSSATAEDLPTASFAGQQASFLNVKGVPYLLDAIKRCWASLYEPRAIFYRAKQGFTGASIAVIVQRMVDADKAGVTFTAHPTTGEDVVIHEACWGLGESLVLGKVSPDRYIISKKDGRIIEKKIDTKETMHVRDVGTERTVEIRVPPDKRDAQVLTEREIERLTKYGMALENHYGIPQDIEWAIKGSKIHILQTRAVTTIKKAEPEKEEKLKGNVILRGLAASPGVGSGVVKIIREKEDAEKVKKGDVLVTEMTSPDLVPTMSKCAAIVTDRGGSTSHAAIVSREMGIPCIVGTDDATAKLKDGDIVTVDGTNGVVYEGKIELKIKEKPKEKIKKKTEEAKMEELEGELEETLEEEEKPTTKLRKLIRKALPKPKTKTKVYMNLGIPDKIDEYKDLPFEGIGLMRIEFIIAGLGQHPLALIESGEQEKYIQSMENGIEKVAVAVRPKPVVVRFSDFKTNEYRDLKGGDKFEPEEANPMMGWRGVSRYITPKFEEAFRLECRAIKKVREKYKNIWVMLPFVRTIEEVEKCLKIMEEEGLKRDKEFKIWIMAEVPSVIFLASEFAKFCDGFSVGSNDLTQFILAVDRDSDILGEMGYFDEKSLAVKVAIKHLIKEAHENGCTVSICGQAPSEYPEYIKFLTEEEIDSISVNPDAVEKTVNIIKEISGS